MRNSDNDVVTYSGISSLPLNYLWEQVANNFTYGYGLDVNLDYRKNFDKAGRNWGFRRNILVVKTIQIIISLGLPNRNWKLGKNRV